MYCINCGVELAPHETKCPLCLTKVVNPDFIKPVAPPFPKEHETHKSMNHSGILFILTFVFLVSVILTLVCDINLHKEITWSKFPAGALILGYIIVVLPLWFKVPNSVIFSSADVLSIILYLHYICAVTGGNWFMTFAFPIALMYGGILIGMLALFKYVKKGALYIIGGAFAFCGAAVVLTEMFLNITFKIHTSLVWSLYPLTVFLLLAVMFIIIAVCKPIRESLQQRFFL